MKRKANERPVKVDWKYCFIWQKRQKKDITDKDDTLKTVANNITEYRNIGELDLDWNAFTKQSMEMGTQQAHQFCMNPLKKNQACFHRTYGSKYDKQKLKRLAKKRDEAERPSSSASSACSSIKKKDFFACFCVLCNQTDLPENLHARGSFHTTKRNVNTQQNSNATESQRSMALKVGNDAFLNLSSTGDASSNELYCHAKCNNDLQNPSINIDKESSSCNIETKWRRAQAFESITSFMLEQETVEPGTTYVKNLKSFVIEEETQTTRFTGRLLASIPNLVTSTMNKNTVVLFDDKVQHLIVNYVQSPDEFYATFQKVVHPI